MALSRTSNRLASSFVTIPKDALIKAAINLNMKIGNGIARFHVWLTESYTCPTFD